MATETTGTTTATAMVPPGDRPDESSFEADPSVVDSEPLEESALVAPVDVGRASVDVMRMVVASFVDSVVTTLEELEEVVDVSVVGVADVESVEEGVSEAGVLEGAGVLLGSAEDEVGSGSALDEASSVGDGDSDEASSVGDSAGVEGLSVGVAAGEEAAALSLDAGAAAAMECVSFFFLFPLLFFFKHHAMTCHATMQVYLGDWTHTRGRHNGAVGVNFFFFFGSRLDFRRIPEEEEETERR